MALDQRCPAGHPLAKPATADRLGRTCLPLQVPTPFKASVADKLTFYWKNGDFKAGLAGVSMQVQGSKSAQASGYTDRQHA